MSPFIAIIGGSGVDEVLHDSMQPEDIERHDVETPFGAPSAPITTGTIGNVRVALLKRHGDGHVHPPGSVPYRANIWALRALGCTHVIATGATGSLREDIAPGDVVICDQLIDRTDGRPRTFFESSAVHVEFADPFCPHMRRWLLDAASAAGVRVHDGGTYVCMEGPSFSTRAESNMHRAWGADVVGMTALPEARLAREAQLAYALVALPTDYDSWHHRPEGGETSLLEEIIGNLQRSTAASLAVVSQALADTQALSEPSPAHSALELAVWTPADLLPPADRSLLEHLRG